MNQTQAPLSAESKDPLPPQKYVVIERRQHCSCCGSDHEWSELFSWTVLPSRLGVSKGATHLKSIDWPRYRIPIERRFADRTKLIPFCHKCYEPSLEHNYSLLDPPPIDSKRVLNFPVASPVVSTASKPKTKPAPASADDLEELLR